MQVAWIIWCFLLAIGSMVWSIQAFTAGDVWSGFLSAGGVILWSIFGVLGITDVVGEIGLDSPAPPRGHNCPLCHSSPCRCRD